MIFYRQCKLRKAFQYGQLVRITHIPEKFAKAGNVLKLKHKLTGEWSDSWFVESVYHRRNGGHLMGIYKAQVLLAGKLK